MIILRCELEGKITQREGQLNAILLVKHYYAGPGIDLSILAKSHFV